MQSTCTKETQARRHEQGDAREWMEADRTEWMQGQVGMGDSLKEGLNDSCTNLEGYSLGIGSQRVLRVQLGRGVPWIVWELPLQWFQSKFHGC